MLHKNIFDAFDDGSQTGNAGKTKKRNKKKQGKGQELPEIIQNAEKIVEKPKQEKIKQPQKQKGVPAEPHPLDRRSGTGIGKEPKKQGGGGLNWGTYKDELKMQDSADKHDLFKDSPKKEQQSKDEKPQKTLDEYYGEQQWIVVGQKGQEKTNEQKQQDIEKMVKEEHLEIIPNKKEQKEEQAEPKKKKKRNKKKKQTDQ